MTVMYDIKVTCAFKSNPVGVNFAKIPLLEAVVVRYGDNCTWDTVSLSATKGVFRAYIPQACLDELKAHPLTFTSLTSTVVATTDTRLQSSNTPSSAYPYVS